MATHDLEQAGVVGQPQRLGGLRNVPPVAFQGLQNDLPLRFGFALLERNGWFGMGASLGIGRLPGARVMVIGHHPLRQTRCQSLALV